MQNRIKAIALALGLAAASSMAFAQGATTYDTGVTPHGNNNAPNVMRGADNTNAVIDRADEQRGRGFRLHRDRDYDRNAPAYSTTPSPYYGNGMSNPNAAPDSSVDRGNNGTAGGVSDNGGNGMGNGANGGMGAGNAGAASGTSGDAGGAGAGAAGGGSGR